MKLAKLTPVVTAIQNLYLTSADDKNDGHLSKCDRGPA